MTLAPIALFVYNRPGHTKKTIDALRHNLLAAESDLFIFSDGIKPDRPDNRVYEVREYLRTIKGFKSVTPIERNFNIGLSANIISGIKQLIDSYGKIIVLEDDLVTSPFFLKFMNDGLRIYENEDEVISIHSYLYRVRTKLPDTFFLRGADCSGWATWKRGWDLFEPDGKVLLQKLIETNQSEAFDFGGNYPYTQMLIDQIEGKTNSWAIRWYASAFVNNKFTLYPGKPLVSNIGGDGTGINSGFDHQMYQPFNPNPISVVYQKPAQNMTAYLAFADFLKRRLNPSMFYRIKRKFNSLFRKVK